MISMIVLNFNSTYDEGLIVKISSCNTNQAHGQNELLRSQNGERLNIERDLTNEERLKLEELYEQQKSTRDKIIEKSAKELSNKLHGL